jgi:hypothetical protein
MFLTHCTVEPNANLGCPSVLIKISIGYIQSLECYCTSTAGFYLARLNCCAKPDLAAVSACQFPRDRYYDKECL